MPSQFGFIEVPFSFSFARFAPLGQLLQAPLEQYCIHPKRFERRQDQASVDSMREYRKRAGALDEHPARSGVSFRAGGDQRSAAAFVPAMRPEG